MLKAYNKTITMAEGDYGIYLPITITGGTIGSDSNIRLTIKKEKNGETILTQNYTNISDNTFNLTFSKEESDLLLVGVYGYSLDWYKNDLFMNNIIEYKMFKVNDKA